MAGLTVCPKCGRNLPNDAPKGLCPACLLASVVVEVLPEDASPADRFRSPTTPGPARFVPPSAASLAPLFPQLEILGLLGHGGMGAVYKARQKKLDRLVALKIIRPEAAADPAFAERFNREARTLARLSHPHIVAVHDFGEVEPATTGTVGPSGTVFYFLMEYVGGANLRQLMDGARLEPLQALAIVPQVCEALQFAHDEGVVHRDIKPENILIDSKGRVKIADFGLAKLVAGSADDFTLTGTHQVMGTPRYMAPEQMEGSHSVDHRADIYSLGVVFYEMLTGQVPAGHFDPPSKKSASDPQLDAIVLRAMAREPERRFQQASHFRSEVEQAQLRAGHVADASAYRSPSTQSLADAVPALSSFLSGEVRAVYRWATAVPEITGAADRTSERYAGPQWLMLLLCLVAGAMMFFPWIDLHVTDSAAVRGLDSAVQAIYGNVPAYHRVIQPLELASGVICGLAIVLLLGSQALTLNRRQPSWSNCVLRMLLCGAALALFAGLRMDLSHLRLTVFPDPDTGLMPTGTMVHHEDRRFVESASGKEWVHRFKASGQTEFVNGEYISDRGQAELHNLHHVAEYRVPFYVAIGCLLPLFCLLGMDLRHATLFRKLQPQAAESMLRSGLMAGMRRVRSGLAPMLGLGATSSPLDLPARLLMWIAVITSIGWFLCYIALIVVYSMSPDHGSLKLNMDLGTYIEHRTYPPFLVLSVLLATVGVIASIGVRNGRFQRLGTVVSVLFLFPLSYTWPVTMPLAAWCLAVLYRPHVRRLFETEDPQQLSDGSGKSQPAFPWGWLASGLLMLLPAFGLILFAQIWTESAWALISGCVVWFAIGAFGEQEEDTPNEQAMNAIAGIAVVSSLLLIGFGVSQTNSVWPLATVVLFFFAVAAGAEAAESVKDGKKCDPPSQPDDNAKPVATSDESGDRVKGSSLAEAASIVPPVAGRLGPHAAIHGLEAEVVPSKVGGMTRAANIPELSPLRTAWNAWWAGRTLWLTRIVQTILSLAFAVSFILFISFGSTSTVVYPTPGGQGVRQTHVHFGTPSPWFELDQNVGGTPGFEWKIVWYSSSVGIMLLGLLAYWIYWQIEKAKPEFKPSYWISPRFVFLVVGITAILCIFLGQLPLLLPDWK